MKSVEYQQQWKIYKQICFKRGMGGKLKKYQINLINNRLNAVLSHFFHRPLPHTYG